MKSVFKSTSSRLALLAAFGLAMSVTQASAADLGGDCCADLEERVAELEATTARKGNRKVSLTISGWVNEAVFWWDDGSESNTYVGTNSLEQSRFRFVGEAQIAPGYSAGYTLEIGTQGDPSNKFDQLGPANGSGSGAPNFLVVRKSNWWLKSKEYGKVTVGLEGTATYHLLDDADGANTRNFADAQAAAVAQGAFFLRSHGAGVGGTTFGTGLRWSDILRGVDNGTEGQNGRRNIVRYDSPEILGFVVTASWGEDDQAGVSLTYKNKWGDFLVLAKGGWEQSTDENLTGCAPFSATGATRENCEWWGGAATIMHAPTGLYAYGGFGQTLDHGVKALDPDAEGTSSTWFIQGGIEQKWIPLGKTTIFGEYRHDDVGSRPGKTFSGGDVQDGNLNFAAAGIIQNIEPAAMDLYLIYRHAECDLTNTVGTTADLDGFDMVMGGALIRF
jgi:predicted porin